MAVLAADTRSHVLADLIPAVDGRVKTAARESALALAGAGFVGLTALISFTIPVVSPVPFTLQTFGVLLVGTAFGPVRALAAMALYMVAGVAGMPWFAEGASGAAGATFGYVLAFLAAAPLAGHLARRGWDRSVRGTVGLMVLGNVVMYAIGASYLAVALGLTASEALGAGVLPFLAGDAVKIAFAAGLLPAAWWTVKKIKG
ncbi:biotin transporter BioY [Salininema proteolyticum]|uniref:Biotin transporter n=1 Tax=Salininema proteolyticum TaxID=1607685 RepID=A0ABV8U0N3_9ACTN